MVDWASSDCERARRVANAEIAEMMDVSVATAEVMNSKTARRFIEKCQVEKRASSLPGRILEPLDRLVNLRLLVIDPEDSALGQSSKTTQQNQN